MNATTTPIGRSPISGYKLTDFPTDGKPATPTRLPVSKDLPDHVDLRDKCPDVYDQGQIGSCTANALAGDIEFVKMKQGQDQTGTPARLDIYEQERKTEHTYPLDRGASVSDGVKDGKSVGYAPESDWPYSKANLNKKPTAQIQADRKDNVVGEAINIDHTDINQLKQSLADGYPVTLGIKVYSSFESQGNVHTGVIPMPDTQSEKLLGGHAMMLVGYDDKSQTFTFRNSWGKDWGNNGYGTIPYQYITSTDLAYPNEFWSVRSVNTGDSKAA